MQPCMLPGAPPALYASPARIRVTCEDTLRRNKETEIKVASYPGFDSLQSTKPMLSSTLSCTPASRSSIHLCWATCAAYTGWCCRTEQPCSAGQLVSTVHSDTHTAGHGGAHQPQKQQHQHHSCGVQVCSKEVDQLLHRWLLVGIALARRCATATCTAALTLMSSVHGVLLRFLHTKSNKLSVKYTTYHACTGTCPLRGLYRGTAKQLLLSDVAHKETLQGPLHSGIHEG